MRKSTDLQDELGSYRRMYKEQEPTDMKAKSVPVLQKKKRKRKRLFDQTLVVYLCNRSIQAGATSIASTPEGKTFIKIDASKAKVVVPMIKVVADANADSDDAGDRYLDNGDVNPDALKLAKLLNECAKLGGTGEGSLLAYSKGNKMVKIRDDKGLAKAVRFLHEPHETDDVLELLFAKAPEVKQESDDGGCVAREDEGGSEEDHLLGDGSVDGLQNPAEKSSSHRVIIELD